jgi:hypothetical protein
VEHPKDIGDVSTLAITLVLRSLGYGLYIPYGENTRCDLMLERDGFVDRVQCKTGRLRKGAVVFNVCSSYLVPITHLPVQHRGALRVDPPKNNQFDRIRLAADYEVGRVSIEGLRGSSGA